MAKHAAFDILYREYYVRVFGLCRRLLNSSEQAEDAAQETFIRAYRNFRKYDADQPFWQWISAIANNHCIDLLRQRNRGTTLFGDEADELSEIESDDTPVLDRLISSENEEALSQAIQTLPDKYRIPLVLAYFNESSYDAIAEELDVSRNHVGVLLLRGKQRLRAALAEPSVEGAP